MYIYNWTTLLYPWNWQQCKSTLLFSCSVVSDSLQPHGLQHTRLPCPSPSGVAQTHVHWVCDVIQPSCPLLLLPSIFPSISLFQRVGCSHQVAKVLKLELQHQSFQWIFSWFPLGLTDSISLQTTELSRVFSSTTVQRHQFFGTGPFFIVQVSHPYITTRKTIALTIWTFVSKITPLLFNKLSRFVITYLPRSKCVLISWRSHHPLILEPKKIVCHHFHCFPIYLPWSDGARCHGLSFLNVDF